MSAASDDAKPRALARVAAELLGVGVGAAGSLRLHPLHGGRNNRVYRLEGGPRPVAMKAYHRDPSDGRDRLGAEWAFVRFAWSHGVRVIPEPIAHDADRGVALYELIEGRPLQPGEVGRAEVAAATTFAAAIQALRRRWRREAALLPIASEACFSLAAHLDLIRARVFRLTAAAAGIAPAAARFVRESLEPEAERILDAARRKARGRGVPIDREIARAKQVISPSDFGFHNALREPSGAIRFLDFEYAGWDDPAKMMCDFFCQPDVPVAPAFWNDCASLVGDQAADRAALLLPAYRIKWVCILLNPLLPEGRARRGFSAGHDGGDDVDAVLAGARRALAAARG